MRKLVLVAAFLVLCGPLAFAQETKRTQFVVGYSNLQAEAVPDPDDPNNVFDDDFFGRRTGLHGVNLSATGYLSSWFGLTGDFSYHRKDSTFSGIGFRNSRDTSIANF